jgi:hypothetical protein
MPEFSFLIRSHKTKKVERVLIKADLIDRGLFSKTNNLFANNSLVNSVKELYLNYIVSKTDDEIKNRYIGKINEINIFFKSQLKNIIQSKSLNENYTNYSDLEFNKNLESVNFFFLEDLYSNHSQDDLDKYKVIVSPDNFIEFLNTSIELSAKINNVITEKYDFLVNTDKELLHKKNEILLKRDVFNFEEIIKILKERESISYILLDIDSEVTNALIKLNDIKYRKIFLDEIDLVTVLTNLKESIFNLQKIKIFCNNYNLLN